MKKELDISKAHRSSLKTKETAVFWDPFRLRVIEVDFTREGRISRRSPIRGRRAVQSLL